MIKIGLKADVFAALDKTLSHLPPPTKRLEFPKVDVSALAASIDLNDYTPIRREISAEELRSFISRVAEGDVFTANGKAVALYIEDCKNKFPTYDVEDLPKVHIVNCGRNFPEGRYVQVINPDGKFKVIFRGGVVVERNLRVCYNCKKTIKAERRGLVGKFNFQSHDGRDIDWSAWNKFIAGQEIAPIRHKDTARLHEAGKVDVSSYGYTDDWPQISQEMRKAAGWRCSDCGVVLAGRDKRYLDCHHMNRNKRDNDKSNLRVLCRLCHREQGFAWAAGDDHLMLVQEDWGDANQVIMERRKFQGINRTPTPAYKVSQ